MNIDNDSNLGDKIAATAGGRVPASHAWIGLAAVFGLAFVALCAYAGYQIHLLPDSFGRAANEASWDGPFRKQLLASRGALLAITFALCCVAIARWDRTVE